MMYAIIYVTIGFIVAEWHNTRFQASLKDGSYLQTLLQNAYNKAEDKKEFCKWVSIGLKIYSCLVYLSIIIWPITVLYSCCCWIYSKITGLL